MDEEILRNARTVLSPSISMAVVPRRKTERQSFSRNWLQVEIVSNGAKGEMRAGGGKMGMKKMELLLDTRTNADTTTMAVLPFSWSKSRGALDCILYSLVRKFDVIILNDDYDLACPSAQTQLE